jgi:hypothetical protein
MYYPNWWFVWFSSLQAITRMVLLLGRYSFLPNSYQSVNPSIILRLDAKWSKYWTGCKVTHIKGKVAARWLFSESSFVMPTVKILLQLRHNFYGSGRSRSRNYGVAPQLFSWGWVDPVPDPLLLRKSGSAGNPTRTSGSGAKNSDH